MTQKPQNFQTKTLNGKAGSMAISTIDFNSWSNMPVTTPVSKNKKIKGVKEIINKIFIECAKVITDQFWIDKFNLAAIGKFPSKFYFNEEILTYRKGAKCHTLLVSSILLRSSFILYGIFSS